MQIKIAATMTDRNWRDIGAFSPVADRFEACARRLVTKANRLNNNWFDYIDQAKVPPNGSWHGIFAFTTTNRPPSSHQCKCMGRKQKWAIKDSVPIRLNK